MFCNLLLLMVDYLLLVILDYQLLDDRLSITERYIHNTYNMSFQLLKEVMCV